jgi:2-polyprenyl-3-methyl-5-hydroxy-6-metoxy-1,4-benzoquinol methylase
MNALPAIALRCPVCRGGLTERTGEATCAACGARFPAVGPILDLRVPGSSWIDYEEDRQKAKRLLSLGELPASALLEVVFRSRSGWTDEQVAHRSRTFLAATSRLQEELDDWLAPCIAPEGTVLDLGCGGGQLLATLARRGQPAVGVDVSLEWLVVADRMIGDRSAPVRLIAALAEALPFADSSFSAVVSIDVFEHVGDQPAYLREMDRVLSAGGFVALSTPNRYSGAAEPHVGVWGVGWLPRRWQKRYVAMRSPLSYDFVRLLSYGEIGRLFRGQTKIAATVTVAPIAAGDLQRMTARRALLARTYNVLVAFPLTRWVFHAIGPFFRVLGRKLGSANHPASGGRAAKART